MNEHRRARPLLGTFVEIGVRANSLKAENAINQAFKAIKKIQDLLSFQCVDSELSQLNCSNGNFITISPLSCRVLRLAKLVTYHSNGLFNCTVGGALINKGILPKHNNKQSLSHGRHDDLELHKNQARLKRPVQITLDGIAKGYAVDHAILILKMNGITSGWVNAGGDLRVYGDINLPVSRRDQKGNISSLGKINNVALSTSCVYTTANQTFPGWIVSTISEKPYAGIWSVFAHKSWLADALTKVASLATHEQRATIVEQLGGKLLQASAIENVT